MTSKLKRAALTLVLSALAVGMAWAAERDDLVGPPAPPPAKLDAFGDPLPAYVTARLGTLRWRHGAPVTFVAYSQDNKELITAAQDGLIRVWEVSTGRLLRHFGNQANMDNNGGLIGGIGGNVAAVGFIGMVNTMTGVAITEDAKTVATSTNDGTITLYDVPTAKAIRTWKPTPQIYVSGLVFSPDGKTLVLKSNDQTLRLHDTADGKEIRKLGSAPDARRRIFFAGGPASSMAFSPDGKTLFSGAMEFENNQLNAVIKRYEAETGKELPIIKGPQGGFQSLALARDGKTLAWSGNDGVLHLWNAETNKAIRQLGGNGTAASSASVFSPDGKTLVTRGYDMIVRVWNVADGKEVRQLGGQEVQNANGLAIRVYGYAASNLAFSPDGKRVAVGSGGNTIRQWNVETGKEDERSAGHHGAVVTLGVSPDGKTAVTRGGDNTVHVWNVATGKETSNFVLPTNVSHVHVAADGKTMGLGSWDGTLRTWDAHTGKEIKEWKVNNNNANPAFGNVVGMATMAMSPDGKLMAVRTFDQTIRVYESMTGRERRVMTEVQAANPNGVFMFQGQPGAMAFSPDNSVLASLNTNAQQMMQFGGRIRQPGQAGSSIKLWDVGTGKPIRKIDSTKHTIACMAFSPDGRIVATANLDNTLVLWETASGKERCTYQTNSKQPFTVLTYSPNGKTLIGSGYDRTIRFYSSTSGKELSHLDGHQGAVVGLALARDAQTLVSGSEDTTALVFDIAGLAREEKAAVADLGSERVDALWAQLASDDGTKVNEAIGTLSTAPAQTVPMLQGRVKPVTAPDPKRVTQLIADLDSNTFSVRQRASDELEKLGELAADALKKVLAQNPGLEMQMRVERLLERLVTGQPPPTEQLQALRALEVLERIGTPEARQVVEHLGTGAAGALFTREARRTLERMAK